MRTSMMLSCALAMATAGCVLPDLTGDGAPDVGLARGDASATGGHDDAGQVGDSGATPDADRADTSACRPDCAGRECGPDPRCGASCGQCQVGSCGDDGRCSTLGLPCDLVSQAPCQAGEKCAFGDAGDAICTPAGARRLGESCGQQDGEDDCARGLLCSGWEGSPEAYCHRTCVFDEDDPETSDESCAADAACLWTLTDEADLCSLPCDPFGADCDSGELCAAFLGSARLVFSCIPDDMSPQLGFGALCEYTWECAQGLLCVPENADDDPRCMPLCDRSHPCSDTTCTELGMGEGMLPNGMGACFACVPDCGDRQCGPDPICGSDCGACAPGARCDTDGQCCTPDCEGRECGTDLVCGTSCGSCAPGAQCGADGQCCAPDCSGRECGADPVCGSSCGSCPGSQTCTVEGRCECVPQCGGRTCGADPVCGVSCGSCGDGQLCQDGQCCTPDCSGRECGTDPVCGTSCGSCGGGDICEVGQCTACKELYASCASSSQCCAYAGAIIECRSSSCQQCAPSGYQCGSVGCCSGLVCNPANICSTEDCSGLGQSCYSDRDCCAGSICDSGAEFTCQRCRGANVACSYDSQCCDGLTCDGTRCVEPCASNGASCWSDDDCCSGTCDGSSYTCQSCRGLYAQCDYSSECCSGLSCQNDFCQYAY